MIRNKTMSNNKNKIDSLKNIIKEISLDAFLVPHNDEFMNEHLPPDAERLRWLTGFSGSAGNALIFADDSRKHILFVDSRYTLQALKEVDELIFDVICTDEISIPEWIKENLPKKSNIGYYPWFYSVYEVEELSKSCKSASSLLHAIDRNIIDELWDDRPVPTINPVEIVPLTFAGLHHKTKIEKVKEVLYQNKMDAAIVTAPDAVSWLLNIRGRNIPYSPVVLAFAIVSPNKPVELVINLNKISPETIEHLGEYVHLVSIDDFSDALVDLSGQRISIDDKSCPMWILNELQSNAVCHSTNFAKKPKILFKPDVCEQLKAVKHKFEIEGMKSCHIKDGVAVTKFLCWFDEKITNNNTLSEIDAANALYNLRKAQIGFSENSFATIAASGKNGAIVHYKATDEDFAQIKKEDILFLCDSGGQYKNEGTTDITRTFPTTAEDVPAEVKRNYTLVLQGHIAASSVIFKKGEAGNKIDKLARHFLKKYGLDYGHGTGHGVGCYLNVHEGPQKISRRGSKIPLEAGMVLSIEPGYYKENEYGIRIENLVQVVWENEKKKRLCFEPLTLAPIDTRLIDENMLSSAEKEWLNDYHNKVKSGIYEYLEPYEQKWFDKNAKKIK
jgi:Xaa-Pro aminopeptidase